jgi:ABC-type transport system involved in multi-copper enzyme maturation permease subunit
MNPVALRELQERFRTLRSPVLLSVWVLIAGAITFLAYLGAKSAAEGSLGGFGQVGLSSILASTSMGRFILHCLLLGLLTAIVFVVPGQAAVTIVGERDRQTLQLLQVSQLGASGIVFGKLASSLAYILLLLVAAVPLMVIPVLLGGVTISQVVSGVFMVMAAAVMIGAVSMWVSSRARSVQGAVLGSYMWAAGLVFGTLALLLAEILLLAPDDNGPTRFAGSYPRDQGRELYTSWVNPYIGMVDASSNVLQFQDQVVTSPYYPFQAVLLRRQGFAFSTAGNILGSSFYGDYYGIADSRFGRFDPASSFTVAQTSTRTVPAITSGVWWKTLLFEAAVALAAMLLAARNIRVPRRRIRSVRSKRRKEAVGAT